MHIHVFMWKWDPTNKRKHTLSDFLILTPFPYYDNLQLYFFFLEMACIIFFFVAEYSSVLYVHQISLLNSMYGQHLSATASNAAIIAHAHMHPCDMPTCSKGGTAGPLGSSTARPWGTSTQTSIVGGPVYKSSIAVPKILPFSSILPSCCLFSWWPLFWAGWGGLSL